MSLVREVQQSLFDFFLGLFGFLLLLLNPSILKISSMVLLYDCSASASALASASSSASCSSFTISNLAASLSVISFIF